MGNGLVGIVPMGISLVKTFIATKNFVSGSRLETSTVLSNLKRLSSIQKISVSQFCTFILLNSNNVVLRGKIYRRV